ncbi:hypothetical protein [Pseudomonas sp.]|uniref:hypothetical protein n=1 Tax=Pseudomonas sp. TaxID=306 RepID=UPI00290B9998|nr:hypothetical protein [Pseudomonas sp.]MDU4255549.1 hypothetical protein [Pseudomonas sp.]
MNTQLNELRRLLAEIDSLAGSVEVSGLIRDARACAEKARSRTAKAIKIAAELDAQAGQVPAEARTKAMQLRVFLGKAGFAEQVLVAEELMDLLAAAAAQGGHAYGS